MAALRWPDTGSLSSGMATGQIAAEDNLDTQFLALFARRVGGSPDHWHRLGALHKMDRRELAPAVWWGLASLPLPVWWLLQVSFASELPWKAAPK